MDTLSAAERLFSSGSREFAVRLWNGRVLPPERGSGVGGTVALRTPRALDAFFPPASELHLAEAILDGDLDLEGDAVALLEAGARWTGPHPDLALGAGAALAWVRRLLRRGRAPLEAGVRGPLHSVGRDRDAVRHHYDVSDDFYRLFLDAGMVYSCGYFPRGGESIDEAQRAKLDLVCRKLALAPGDRFLDVGCGWGALVEHAVASYGAKGRGITVSANQLTRARARLARFEGHAEALGADWRTLGPGGPYDKIASVGMMEHVGRRRLDAYFVAIHRLLRPGGLFLNHAIADAGGDAGSMVPWATQRGGGFIWRYVFPDGELIPIAEVVAAAERAGFEVRDLECLREHYAETLEAWLARLEARFAEAVAIAGERRARLYRLYLAASAAAFRLGKNSVHQLLLARRDAAGRAEGVPRARAEWYAPRVAPLAAAPPPEERAAPHGGA